MPNDDAVDHYGPSLHRRLPLGKVFRLVVDPGDAGLGSAADMVHARFDNVGVDTQFV